MVDGMLDLTKLGLDQESFFKLIISMTFDGKIFTAEDVIRLLNQSEDCLQNPLKRAMIIDTANSITDIMINLIPKMIKDAGVEREDYLNADTKGKKKILDKIWKHVNKSSKKAKYFIVNEAIREESGMHYAKLMYTLSSKKEVKECMEYVTKKLEGDDKVNAKLISKNDKIWKFEFTEPGNDMSFRSNFIILNADRYDAFCKYYKIEKEDLVNDWGAEMHD